MTVGLDAGVGRAFFGDFTELRPVQTKAIPPILAGSDVLVRAPTASGKTEAAIAPLVSRYLPMLRRTDIGVGLIIVSPTRALVNDLHRRLSGPLESLGISSGVRHGERNHLRLVNPPAVLLTTPESLDIEVGRRPDAIKHTQAVVLDEAHLLYNTQRGAQVAIALARLRAWLDRDVQVVGLSATIGRPKDVWQFFRPGHVVDDIKVDTGRELDLQLRLNVSVPDLVRLLSRADDAKVLAFVNSRRECDVVVDQLKRSGLRCPVFAHHSSLSRDAREDVESSFEAAPAAICISTSTLELGIDIGSIDLIVVYGVPADWQSLAQRIGRGNRRSGSIVAMLCTSAQHPEPSSVSQLLGFQALILQASEPEIADERPREIFGAVGQQLASWLVAGERYRGINTLTAPMSAWPHLDQPTVTAILDELVEHDVLKRHPAYRQYGPSDGAHELERTWDLWSNFTGAGREVNVSTAGAALGRISARDAERLASGDCFLLGGRRWRVTSKSMFDVDVRPTDRSPNVELRYSSTRPTEGALHAEAVRRVLGHPADGFCEIKPVASHELLMQLVMDLAPLASDDALPVHHGPHHRAYLTFAGAQLNRAIARWAGDQHAVEGPFILETTIDVDWASLPQTIHELSPATELPPRSARTRFQDWLPTDLAMREQRSADLAPYGHDAVLRRLRNAVELPVDVNAIELFRT